MLFSYMLMMGVLYTGRNTKKKYNIKQLLTNLNFKENENE